MFPATLFDFNGVLVDDEHVHLAVFRELVAPLGVALSEQAYWDRYLGFDDVGAFTAILTDAGLPAPPERVAALVAEKAPRYLDIARRELRVFPGAAELVRARAEAGPVGVVSGALRAEIELGLSVLGVRDRVAHIVAAEDVARCKPDPEGYQLGLRWLQGLVGAEAARAALVVEDSLAGVEAGVAAGLPVVGVAHSYPEAALRGAGARGTVARLADLTPAYLEQLGAATP